MRLWKTGKIIGWRADRKFIWSSPTILLNLIRFRPDVLFTSGFHLCSAYVLLMKLVMRWNVVLVWDGVSPEVSKTENRPLRRWVRRLMGAFFDRAVTNTREGKEYLVSGIGIPERKIVQEPYEVPHKAALQRVGTEPSLNGASRPRFIFVGTVCPPKGVHYLIEACCNLVRQGIREFSCIMVGQSSPEYQRELADNYPELRDCIQWVGPVPYEDLGAYYEACDVFVFPTLGDIWGMVVLEAMAFGKPVLCSHFAGSREMIRHGENGFIFNPERPEELAAYMAEFIRRPELILEMGLKSAEIIAPHTAERAARMLSNIAISAAQNGRCSPTVVRSERNVDPRFRFGNVVEGIEIVAPLWVSWTATLNL